MWAREEAKGEETGKESYLEFEAETEVEEDTLQAYLILKCHAHDHRWKEISNIFRASKDWKNLMPLISN